MGNRDTAGRRPALRLAAAVLGATLVGGTWGPSVRAELLPRIPPPVRATPAEAPTDRSSADQPRSSSYVPTRDPQAAVAAAAAALVGQRAADSVSIAALDTVSGLRVGWGVGSGMTAASVFKLLLLEGYLLQNQDRGEPPGDGGSDALAAMIENSDNDSANQVYESLGGAPGVDTALRRLGLSATVLAPDDQWGLSMTGAGDQLTLLTDLVAARSPLSSASQAYALGLMSNIEPDQRWGVTAAADPGTGFAGKNGWLDVEDDGGRWAVNSVGVIQAGGHQILLAVLTQHDVDMSTGIALVESLSRSVADSLRDTASAPAPEPVAGSSAQG